MMMLFDESLPDLSRTAPSSVLPTRRLRGTTVSPILAPGPASSSSAKQPAAAAVLSSSVVSRTRIINNSSAGLIASIGHPRVPDILRALIPLGLDLADHLVHPLLRRRPPLHQRLRESQTTGPGESRHS